MRSLLRWFSPHHWNGAELRFQAETIALYGLFQLLAGTGFALIELLYGTFELGLMCALVLPAIAAVLLRLHRGADPTRAGAALLWIHFGLVSAINFATGGAAIGSNLALPSLALFAVLLFPGRIGLYWIGMILCEILLVAALRNSSLVFPVQPDPDWTRHAIDRVPLLFVLSAALCGVLLQRALGQFREHLETARQTEARAREQAAHSALQLAGFAGLAADGFWETDAELRLVFVSNGLAQALGCNSAELLGLTPEQAWRRRFPGAPDLSAWMRQLQLRQPFAGQELQTRDQARQRRLLVNRGQPLSDAAGAFAGFRGVVHDITAQRQAEAAELESERRIRLLTDHLPAPISYIDAGGVFRFSNPAHQRWLGRARDDIIGQPVAALFDHASLAQVEHHLAQALSGVQVGFELEPTALRDSYQRLEFVPELDSAGQVLGIYSLVHDITALKRELHAEREKSGRMLLTVAEREQERLGRELHDGVGQELAGAAFLAKALATRLAAAAHPLAADAERIKAILRQSVENVRLVSRQLSPTRLEYGEILPALERLCADIEQSYGICSRFRASPEARLACVGMSAHSALQLYRVTQEALNNATRHGACRSTGVLLDQRGAMLRLAIVDDGIGFAAAGPDRPVHGVGLPSMRLRALGLGGRIRFGRRRGITAVLLRIPLDRLASPSTLLATA